MVSGESPTAFTAEQFHATWGADVAEHFWNLARNRLILDEIRRSAGPTPFRDVLEIGCGPGYVLRALRAGGVPVRGVEIAPDVPVPAAVADYVATGTDCFDLPLARRSTVDCLLMLDVIEHLPDPVTFLARLPEAFPAARVLIVTVPARAELWSNYDTFFGHFRRYSRPGLSADLRAAGFAPLRSRYLFKSLYPVMLALKHVAGQRATTLAPPGQPALHRLIAWCFRTEAAVLPAGVWGTSIICTAARGGANR